MSNPVLISLAFLKINWDTKHNIFIDNLEVNIKNKNAILIQTILLFF
jgi:hypothetical protein